MPARYMTLRTLSPRSFLFYIVANIGPDHASRPLAVAYRQGSVRDNHSVIRANRVINDILRIMAVISDAENRACIEGELALAARWYQDQGDIDPIEVAERPKISDSPQPALRPWNEEERYTASLDPLPGLPWTVKRPEFPVISSCLIQSLLGGYGANETRLCDVQLQPASTVFLGDCLEYGMVAIDISQLDTLRYGIVAFPVRYKANVFPSHEAYWDAVEDDWPDHEPDVVLQPDRPRVLSDIHQYLWNNRVTFDDESNIRTVASYGVVDQAVLSYIWPLSNRNSSYIDTDQYTQNIGPTVQDSGNVLARLKNHAHLVPSFLRRLKDPDARHQLRLARVDRAVDVFLLEAQGYIDDKKTTLKALRESTEHLSCLRQKIQTTPTLLEKCQNPVQLLQIAYTGCVHLNWATFSRLSYETLAEVLLSSGLATGSYLSLTADPNREGNIGTLIHAILRLPSLRKVNLLELPGRDSDRLSMQIYNRLSRSVKDTGFLRQTIFSAGAFSAPLCKSRVPSPGGAAFNNDMPTLRLFLSRAFTSEHYHTRSREKVWSLDDVILNPGRFAIGFIRFLRHIASDKAFLHFSCGPVAVDTDQRSQLALSPILADPFIDLIEEVEGGVSSQVPTERVPGSSWMIILQVAEHVNLGVEPNRVHLDQTTIVRYSFLKVTREIYPMDEQEAESYLPDALDVVGALKDFLSYLAPAISGNKIDELLERAGMDLRTDGNDTLPPDMTSIGILPKTEVMSLLARKYWVPASSSHLDHSEGAV